MMHYLGEFYDSSAWCKALFLWDLFAPCQRYHRLKCPNRIRTADLQISWPQLSIPGPKWTCTPHTSTVCPGRRRLQEGDVFLSQARWWPGKAAEVEYATWTCFSKKWLVWKRDPNLQIFMAHVPLEQHKGTWLDFHKKLFFFREIACLATTLEKVAAYLEYIAG